MKSFVRLPTQLCCIVFIQFNSIEKKQTRFTAKKVVVVVVGIHNTLSQTSTETVTTTYPDVIATDVESLNGAFVDDVNHILSCQVGHDRGHALRNGE